MVVRSFLPICKSNERSEDSYIGLADYFLFVFFSGKSLKIFGMLKFAFSWFDFLLLFKFSAFPLLKVRQTSLSNSRSEKVTENARFPSEIQVLPIDPVFSNWVNFNKKVSMINFSTNSENFKAIFFSKFKRYKFLKKKTCQFLFQFHCVHNFFPTVSWLCLIFCLCRIFCFLSLTVILLLFILNNFLFEEIDSVFI